MTEKEPLVSIVISNRNSGKFLLNCINSILSNVYSNYEIIIVDNASTDDSLGLVDEAHGGNPHVLIVRNKNDLGPAAGRNLGIGLSKGKYVAFLDSDTEVDRSWLHEMVKKMERDSTLGACQSKLLLMDDRTKFDYAGDYLSPFGILVQRASHGEEDRGQFSQVSEIFTAKSSSMMTRRDALLQAGLFDEDYYMFVEETDLSWRIWLRGYRILYVPKSIVYHKFGTYTNAMRRISSYHAKYLYRYHGTKNYIMTCIKNFGTLSLLKALPIHLMAWIGLSLWFVAKRELPDAGLVVGGILWNLKHLDLVVRKRIHVQRFVRKVPDKVFFRSVLRKQSLLYFYRKFRFWKKTIKGY